MSSGIKMTNDNRFLNFFVRELPLILRVGRKLNRAGDICKRALDIEFEQAWSVGLGTTLGDGKKIKKIFF